ncbi:cathepsin W [Rhinolophus ferrumequinum]|uniref:Cathepsin W n=1 Tax=Rhinolophus ferrumequinum TaxID=59479 RepID=A0A7J7W6G8_RHIFE|nr:cathepsin W [Rhinolophus ferrumequinum]
MALTVHLSCFLALLVAGLAQDIMGSRRGQDPGPQPLKLKEVFTLFQIRYNRSYSNPAEYARRLDIFARNLAEAQRLQEEDLGTAEFGVTPFSDLTEEEFGQLYGLQRAAGRALNVDRKKNCNCCWAITAAGNIESLWGITFQKSVEVSVQQLLDCNRCGDGCKGGYIWDAFITVLNDSGLASEKDYPFRATSRTHNCQAKKYKKVAWIQDFIMLPDCEQGIARYLATEGPITVTINVKLLQHYQKGVIKATPTNCDPQHVDHSVLLVGFGKCKSVEGRQAATSQSRPHPRPRHSIPYWILKNSWGASWGEEGYFRLHRGSNACGITKFPVTARVVKPAKKQQKLVSCPP